MSNGSRLQTLTIIQAVVFFAIATACVVATFVEHVSAFLFLGIGIAACTVVSLIDKAAISPDNGGFMFVTGDSATWVNMGLFAVAMVFMVLSASGVIRIA
jgi:hypothetical protein